MALTVIDGPASWAFDAQLKGRPLASILLQCPHLISLSCAPSFLIVLPLRPGIHPDMRLRSRSDCEAINAGGYSARCPFRRVGPWSGVLSPGRWGGANLPASA